MDFHGNIKSITHIYSKHNESLKSLYKLYYNSEKWEPLNLILLDKHDDMAGFYFPKELTKLEKILNNEDKRNISEEKKKIIQELKEKNISLERFNDLIVPCIKNNEWLIIGMDIGIIKDVVLLGTNETLQFNLSHIERHLDLNGIEHSIYLIKDFLGIIEDINRRETKSLEFSITKEEIPWLYDQSSLLLEIDLDVFFDSNANSEKVIYSQSEIQNSLNITHFNISVKEFIKQWVCRSININIALEPEYTGGQSELIFSHLNETIFENKLTLNNE